MLIIALVFFAFLALKLSGVWAGVSWLWITAPVWIPAAISVIVGIWCIAFGLGLGALGAWASRHWEP